MKSWTKPTIKNLISEMNDDPCDAPCYEDPGGLRVCHSNELPCFFGN